GRGAGATFTFEDLGDLGNLFGDIFGSQMRYSPDGGKTYRPRKGEQLVFSIEVPFDLAVSGGKTTVTVPRSEACSRCGGSGAEPGTKPTTCTSCNGRGSVSVSQGAFAFSRPCPQCLGRGTVNADPCRDCHGSGAVKRTRNITVNIPKGINDGAKIRLAGQGEAGVAGGPPGDLYLLVHVPAHPEFRRQGNDVYSSVKIDMADAALGTKVSVNTLDGTVNLNIPPGTQPGTTLRLRDRGVKTAAGAHGHHYVTVEVSIPRDLSEKRRQLLEQFKDAG
ncbi:MAG: DnaJ C-terminal domain-containing protein, partial [Planctomycetota bacterium]